MTNIKTKLKDIGFTLKEIENFVNCQNNFKKQCELLDYKRKKILDAIHKEEKQITNLDYLKYTLEKERDEN